MILLFITQINILFLGLLERLSSGGSTKSKRASGKGEILKNELLQQETGFCGRNVSSVRLGHVNECATYEESITTSRTACGGRR
jgi:hypothetical protein